MPKGIYRRAGKKRMYRRGTKVSKVPTPVGAQMSPILGYLVSSLSTFVKDPASTPYQEGYRNALLDILGRKDLVR